MSWAYEDKIKGQQVPAAKGKGKGKGTGKKVTTGQTAQPQAPSAEQFAALRQERLAALKGDAAPAPQEANKTAAEAAKLPGGTPPAQQDPPAGEEAAKEHKEHKEPWQPRDLECNVIDGMNAFQETFHEVVASTTLDLFPSEDHLPKDAEVIVKELLAENKEAESTLEYSNLQKEVSTLKQQLALGIPGSAGEKALQALLTQQETALAKAEKKKPSTAVQSQSLCTVLNDWQLGVRQSEQRGQMGEEKATLRRNERWEAVNKLETHMALIKSALQHHDQSLEKAHQERMVVLAQRNEKVVDTLSQKIGAAKEEEEKAKASKANTAATHIQSTAQPTTQVDPALQQALNDLESFKQEQQRLMKKISDMQAATAAAEATAAEATAAAAEPMDVGVAAPATPVAQPRTPAEAHAVRIRYTKDDLVTLERELNKK